MRDIYESREVYLRSGGAIVLLYTIMSKQKIYGPRFSKTSSLYHDRYMRRLHSTSWPARSVLRASRWTMEEGEGKGTSGRGGGITGGMGGAGMGERPAEGNPQRGIGVQDGK